MKMSFDVSLTKKETAPGDKPGPGLPRGIRIAILAASGAALFFAGRWMTHSDPPAPVKAVVENTPRPLGFVKADDTTQGGWRGIYGSQGVAIATEKPVLPSYVKVHLPTESSVWVKSVSGDSRAPLMTRDPVDRIASAWYSFSDFAIDIEFTDGHTHQLALYLLDWDSTTRQQIVRITDVATSNVLDEREASGFYGGRYLVWNLKGHFSVKVTHVAGANAVASALFVN